MIALTPEIAARELLRRREARRSLLAFTCATKPDYTPSWHHRVIAAALDDVVEGRCRRLLVLVPPRHGKSELVSVRLPAYYLGRYPDRRVLAASYGTDLARSLSRQARAVVGGQAYRVLFPSVRLADEPNTAVEWATTAGGVFKCAGVGAGLTGRGFDLGLIDDPVKDRVEADSVAHRERVWRWYSSVFFTRRQTAEAAIVLIQTRWHEDDLAGRLLRFEGDQWRVLSLSAIAESKRDPIDPRAEGEPLWPERFDAAALDVVRRQGTRDWAALYQQRPALDTGSVFRRDWIRYYDWSEPWIRGEDRPPVEWQALRRYATVDLAASLRTSADYTVICSWGWDANAGVLYLLDCVREHLDAPSTLAQLHAVQNRWRLDRLYIESVAYQLALVQLARSEGLPCEELRRDRDKLSRAYAAAPLVEQGRVYLPRSARWLADAVHELLVFPAAAHDDFVDAFADGCVIARQQLGTPSLTPLAGTPRRGWRAHGLD